MEGKKVPKVLCFVGIFVLIVAISGLIVGLVLYFKSNDTNEVEEREAEWPRYFLVVKEMLKSHIFS